MNYVIRPTSKDITHHGILGQKWGKRQGPPYPLDGSDHSAAEQKAGWKKSLDKKANRLSSRMDRKISKAEKYHNKISSRREANRSKIESKYDKKISKIDKDIRGFDPIKNGLKDKNGRDILTKEDVTNSIKELESKKKEISDKKNAKLTDFDLGTKYVNKADDIYVGILKEYKDMKVKSLYDKDIRKTPEYREVMSKYGNQLAADMYYGKAGTRIAYIEDIAKQRHKYTTKSTDISLK